MSKGSNRTTQASNQTSSVSPDPQAMAAYSALLSRATDVSNKPFQGFGGPEVAPINERQLYGADTAQLAAAGFAPYAGEAGYNISQAGKSVSPWDINQYMDPYTTGVINATQADFDVQNKRAKAMTDSAAASQGALGGNRVGVAEALTQEGQERVQAPVMANLRSQGFQQAVTNANAQKQRQLQAGQVMSAEELRQAQGQFAFGTAEQQTQQAQYTQAMTDYYTQQGYDFATAQWLAGIVLGTGPQMGSTSTGSGTSTTQGPQPNQWAQVAGLGLSAAAMFSDERLKENIREIGRLHDGQKIYRYNFKGDPTTQVGMLSHEVEKDHPEAVGKVAGFGTVDYDKATEDAVKRWSGGAIRGFAEGGTPYGPGTQGWVPTIGKVGGTELRNPGFSQPRMNSGSQGQPDYNKMGKDLGTIGKGLWDKMDFGGSSGWDWGADPTGGMGALEAGAYAFRRGGPVSTGFASGGHVRGFEDGGVPSFDDRFSAISDEPGVPPVRPIRMPESNVIESKGFEPVEPSLSGVENPPLPRERPTDPIVPTPIKTESISPLTGEGAIEPSVNPDKSTPTSGYADNMERVAAAHKQIESGNNYGEVGRPNPRNGDRPYGAYQVMGENIGPWTKKFLGRELTPSEFLRSKEAQDAVYKGQMGEYINQYGLEGALDRWLGLGKQDFLGTTHPEYKRRFMAAYSGTPSDSETKSDEYGGIPGLLKASFRGDTFGVPRGQPPYVPGVAGPQEKKREGMGGFNPLGLSDEARQGLISMGLGMMASRHGGSGSFLSSIGEGGMQGMTTYASAKAATAARDALERKEAFEREKFSAEYSQMKPADKVRLQELKDQHEFMRVKAAAEHLEKQRAHDLAVRKPLQWTDDDGVAHMAIPEPQKDGSIRYWPINLKTGEMAASPLGGSFKEGADRALQEKQQQQQPPGEGFGKPQAPAELRQASLSDGIIVQNNELMKQPYDYRRSAPVIEKGMDVPEPQSVSGKSVRAIKQDAENYIQTGKLPPTSRGASPVAIQQQKYSDSIKNYAGAILESRGITPEQGVDMWRTAPGMLRYILGADGRATVSLGTAVRHLDTVRELAQAWNAKDTQALNRLRAVISRQFGDSAATNLDVVGSIIGPEIIKALGVAGAGTAEEREAAARAFNTAKSPKQLMDAIMVTQKLLGGQLEGKRRQASLSGVSEDKFKFLIGDRPYEILSNIDKPNGANRTSSPPPGAQPMKRRDGTKVWQLPDGSVIPRE